MGLSITLYLIGVEIERKRGKLFLVQVRGEEPVADPLIRLGGIATEK